MQIKMIEILNFLELYEDYLKDLKLSLNLSYKFVKIKSIGLEEKNFYSKKFMEYLDEYGEKDSKGKLIEEKGNFKIKKEFLLECQEKILELNNLLIDVPDVYFFALNDLKNLELAPNQVEALVPFILNEE